MLSYMMQNSWNDLWITQIFIYVITVTWVYAQNPLADSLMMTRYILMRRVPKYLQTIWSFLYVSHWISTWQLKKEPILQEVTNTKGEGGQDPKQGLDMNKAQVIKVEGNHSVMTVHQGNILKYIKILICAVERIICRLILFLFVYCFLFVVFTVIRNG